ncbi:MAG: type II toxin-antitoxin system VapC family toxin [Candidatus Baldrarchaeia archaeon]
MKAFLDASLPTYLLVLENEELRRYSSFLSEIMRKYELYTDPIVADEILWICRKKYRIPYNITSAFVRSVIIPVIQILEITESDITSAMDILTNGELDKPSDAIHLAVMRREGITAIITEDEDFNNIRGIARIWVGQQT